MPSWSGQLFQLGGMARQRASDTRNQSMDRQQQNEQNILNMLAQQAEANKQRRFQKQQADKAKKDAQTQQMIMIGAGVAAGAAGGALLAPALAAAPAAAAAVPTSLAAASAGSFAPVAAMTTPAALAAPATLGSSAGVLGVGTGAGMSVAAKGALIGGVVGGLGGMAGSPQAGFQAANDYHQQNQANTYRQQDQAMEQERLGFAREESGRRKTQFGQEQSMRGRLASDVMPEKTLARFGKFGPKATMGEVMDAYPVISAGRQLERDDAYVQRQRIQPFANALSKVWNTIDRLGMNVIDEGGRVSAIQARNAGKRPTYDRTQRTAIDLAGGLDEQGMPVNPEAYQGKLQPLREAEFRQATAPPEPSPVVKETMDLGQAAGIPKEEITRGMGNRFGKMTAEGGGPPAREISEDEANQFVANIKSPTMSVDGQLTDRGREYADNWQNGRLLAGLHGEKVKYLLAQMGYKRKPNVIGVLMEGETP